MRVRHAYCIVSLGLFCILSHLSWSASSHRSRIRTPHRQREPPPSAQTTGRLNSGEADTVIPRTLRSAPLDPGDSIPAYLSVAKRLQQFDDSLYKLLAQIQDLSQSEIHGFRYWMHAGTLIGSLLYHSRIPWDDDTDFFVDDRDATRLEAAVRSTNGTICMYRYKLSNPVRSSCIKVFFCESPKIPGFAFSYPFADMFLVHINGTAASPGTTSHGEKSNARGSVRRRHADSMDAASSSATVYSKDCTVTEGNGRLAYFVFSCNDMFPLTMRPLGSVMTEATSPGQHAHTARHPLILPSPRNPHRVLHRKYGTRWAMRCPMGSFDHTRNKRKKSIPQELNCSTLTAFFPYVMHISSSLLGPSDHVATTVSPTFSTFNITSPAGIDRAAVHVRWEALVEPMSQLPAHSASTTGYAKTSSNLSLSSPSAAVASVAVALKESHNLRVLQIFDRSELAIHRLDI